MVLCNADPAIYLIHGFWTKLILSAIESAFHRLSTRKVICLHMGEILAVGSGGFDGSALLFAYNFPTTRRISFIFGMCIQ